MGRPVMAAFYIFQSTLLMRGATFVNEADMRLLDFNPRSSCEERRDISIK